MSNIDCFASSTRRERSSSLSATFVAICSSTKPRDNLLLGSATTGILLASDEAQQPIRFLYLDFFILTI